MGKVAELVPVLREGAAKTERLRRMPQETVEDSHTSGLMRIAQPERFGGLGPDFDHFLNLATEPARGSNHDQRNPLQRRAIGCFAPSC